MGEHDNIGNPEFEPVPISYDELSIGDRFIFLYPHHENQTAAWLWVRAGIGYRRIDKEKIRRAPVINMPIAVCKIPEDIPYENGTIQMPDL